MMFRRYLYGLIGLTIAATLIYFGEAKPPSQLFLFGLMIGAISSFYLIIIGVVHFAGYLIKELGYSQESNQCR